MRTVNQKLLILFMGLGLLTYGQDSTLAGRELGLEEFLRQVGMNHPNAIQAQLKIQGAASKYLASKGQFDPKLQADIDRKEFDGKTYYLQQASKLSIPTRFGPEFSAEYARNQGVFLNPENQVPAQGLMQVGVEIPVLQGLIIDADRAEFLWSKYGLDFERSKQVLEVNKLLAEAGKAYWKWYEAYNLLKVYQSVEEIAFQRLNAVKSYVELGDRPAIDTVEARIQWQARKLARIQAELDYENSLSRIETFLWTVDKLDLSSVQPISHSNMEASSALGLGLNWEDHPVQTALISQTNILETDLRLKKEGFKPELNFKYKPISSFNGTQTPGQFNANDYVFGLDFSMPLYLRKARGSVEEAQLNVQINRQEMRFQNAQWTQSWIQAKNQVNFLLEQVSLAEQQVADYERLLAAERRLFRIGESSLFLVNSREFGYIQSQVKFIQLQSKYGQALIEVQYSSGSLTENFAPGLFFGL